MATWETVAIVAGVLLAVALVAWFVNELQGWRLIHAVAGSNRFFHRRARRRVFHFVRPVLRSRAGFRDFYAQPLWSDALRLRFAGIKGKLATAISMAITAIIALHDFILGNALGIDWTPVRDLLPAWAWPFILLADFWLISRFRQMTDRRQAEA